MPVTHCICATIDFKFGCYQSITKVTLLVEQSIFSGHGCKTLDPNYKLWASNNFWQSTTPVTVGWFDGRTWANNNNWYT
jgi:hypothetical protein